MKLLTDEIQNQGNPKLQRIMVQALCWQSWRAATRNPVQVLRINKTAKYLENIASYFWPCSLPSAFD